MSGRFSPKLKRRPPIRNPKRRLIVVCEGKLTEPEYLKALAKNCGALIVIEGGCGTPMSVVGRASELSPRGKRRHVEGFEKRDEIWVVFDRDEHPYFFEAINRAKSLRIGVAYSNPCFELWFILHFEDWNKPMDRHGIQAHLRTRFPHYDRSKGKTIPFASLVESVENAESRAYAQCSNRGLEGDSCGNPSTSVYCLTQRIKEFGKV